MLMISGVKWST